jgi:hypothetical protein
VIVPRAIGYQSISLAFVAGGRREVRSSILAIHELERRRRHDRHPPHSRGINEMTGPDLEPVALRGWCARRRGQGLALSALEMQAPADRRPQGFSMAEPAHRHVAFGNRWSAFHIDDRFIKDGSRRHRRHAPIARVRAMADYAVVPTTR